jgi:adenosylcobinamide-phosphate synthase
MTRAYTIAAAYLLDWVAGDPEWLPHPVRLMGKCAQGGEALLRRTGEGTNYELVAGGALSLGMVGVFYLGAAKAIKWAYRIGGAPGMATELLLGWTCLASRSLVNEANSVIRALEREDLPYARQRLARIVGRDTQALGEIEIHRAIIETLAESACDGIVAPVMYMAIGGVPLSMAYKAISTLDSMIGHTDERHFYFGKAAARLDDVANYLPSRLTALAIATAAGMGRNMSGASAWRTWLRDGGKHASPNAGQPESAMAGALRVRLGGENTYAGELLATPVLGSEFEQPRLDHAKRAIRLVIAVSVLSAVVAIVVRFRKRNIPDLQRRSRFR